MDELATQLRAHQEAHPQMGKLATALHTFADQLIDRYFADVDMPQIALSFEKTTRNRMGHYRPFDGYLMIHTVNLNIYTMLTGLEAAETLAHELVHVWEQVDGHPTVGNRHDAQFHAKALELGIETRGSRGMHVRTTDVWMNFMEENADLRLGDFLLPGINQKPRRQLNLFHCACEGGNPIRSRRWLDVTCNDCGEDYEYVPVSDRKRKAKGPS